MTDRLTTGNALGMKIAVSIPDDVVEAGERLARRLKTSRSGLYARALTELLVQHDEDEVTAALNRTLDEVGVEVDEVSRRAADRTLRRVEW